LNPIKIIVSGVPHYDKYIKAPFISREEFFRRIGLDPDKKTVLFFPLCDYRIVRKGGEAPAYTDKDALEALSKISANVIVRFPPNETVTTAGFKKPANFFYDQPGVSFGKGATITTRELSTDDDARLADELYYSDVVVSGPSTAAIDAAVFDKPIIFLDFGRGDSSSLVGRIFEYESEHIVNVLKTGGVKRARNERELTALVENYFKNPSKDREGRARIREEQCFRLDGNSSKRIAAEITAVEMIKYPYKTTKEMRENPDIYSAPCYGLPFGITTFEKYESILTGKRVLDCGTGSGHFLNHIEDYDTYGVDVVDVRVEKKGNFAVVDTNTEKLPFPDNFFDAVTTWCLLPHLENPHHFIREVYRVLKPGGIFFNEMPNTSLYARKLFFLTGELERYTMDNDHISVFTPAIYKKTILKYFNELAVEYWVDPKIYRNRLGWLKKIGVERNWRNFRKLYASEMIQILKK
ncbi:MAG: Methylase involved in ubiquinone/menaquinone biosynthesis-like protein, partial [Parcubacteria group bacterium Gr01-1014_73]